MKFGSTFTGIVNILQQKNMKIFVFETMLWIKCPGILLKTLTNADDLALITDSELRTLL
jgi:hypothetical protein